MTPESMALTGEGAAGCASGSQIWPKGHMPILMPKPIRKSAKAKAVVPGLALSSKGRLRAHRIEVVLQTSDPAGCRSRHREQLRPDHGGGAGDLHHDEELVGGAYIFALPVFETDERIAGQRHHLPEEEEEPHHVGSAQQAVHCRQKQQEIGVVARHAVLLVQPHVA